MAALLAVMVRRATLKRFRKECAEKCQFFAKGSFPVDIQQYAFSYTRNLIKFGMSAVWAIMAGYPTLSVIGMKAPIKAFNLPRAPKIAGDADDNFCLGIGIKVKSEQESRCRCKEIEVARHVYFNKSLARYRGQSLACQY